MGTTLDLDNMPLDIGCEWMRLDPQRIAWHCRKRGAPQDEVTIVTAAPGLSWLSWRRELFHFIWAEDLRPEIVAQMHREMTAEVEHPEWASP